MNPYFTSDKAIEPKMFYGYRDELDTIVKNVFVRYPKTYFLIGGSKMGKTIFLRHLERHLKEVNIRTDQNDAQIIVPVYLNVSHLIELRHPPADILGEIAEKILEIYVRTTSPLITISHLTKACFQDVKTASSPPAKFIESISRLRESVEPPRQLRIALLLDNLWLNFHMAYDLRAYLLVILSEISLNNTLIAVLASSYYKLGDEFSPGSSLEGILTYQELHVFDKTQSLALITEPTDGKISPEVAQEIYQETGGHPYLIQNLMVSLGEKKSWEDLTMKDIGPAEEIVHFGMFKRWWESMSKIDRDVYGYLYENEGSSDSDLYRRIISNGYANISSPITFIQSLRTLCTLGLIRENDSYTYELAGRWPARWFRQFNKG